MVYFNELRYKVNKIFCFDNDEFKINIPHSSRFNLIRDTCTRIEIRRPYLDSNRTSIKIVWMKNIGIVGIEDNTVPSFISSYSEGLYFHINDEYHSTPYKPCYNKTLLEFIFEYGRGPKIDISNEFNDILEGYFVE